MLRRRSGVVILLITSITSITSILATPAQLPAARRVKLVVELPEGLPAGLRLPLPARVKGRAAPGAVLLAQHDAFGPKPVLVQCDVSGRRAWLLAAVVDGRSGSRQVKLSGEVMAGGADSKSVRFVPRTGGLECLDGDRKVMFYQREAHSLDDGVHVTANYFHPLYGLDGEILTQDFPKDHPHHHGIFWAWHQLLVGKTRAGDPWVNKDFLPVVRRAEVIEEGPVFATLATRVDWTSKHVTDPAGRPRPIVSETGRFRVFHSVGDARHIDFRITLVALLDEVRIGGSENVKGYSGFTVRMKPPMEMVIHDRRGRLEGDTVGTTSAWADISGRYSKGPLRSGLSILCDSRLPEFPPKWLLRHYGMQNVAYPGREAVGLPRGKPLVLRHRLVVHRGGTSRAGDQQAAYQALAIGVR